MEVKRRTDNARKAKAAADYLFPGEKWINVEDGIYLSSRRPVGKNSNYKDELRDAQILRDLGSTVYLVPENSRQSGRKYDAIVNGMNMEFKNMHGSSTRTLREHFLDSRGQAPNVFINLERSPLTRSQIMETLYGAINSIDYTKKSINFTGGRIILKIKDRENLVFLKVDDLKKHKKTGRRTSGWLAGRWAFNLTASL